ncbi:MAG: PEP-CTERM sorting domain-containing protein [Pseudomonadota bacterium]
MRKHLTRLIALSLALGASAANATYISETWHDQYHTKQLLNKKNSEAHWTFNIKRDGFRPGMDYVVYYGITLYVEDDEKKDKREIAIFDQPGKAGDVKFKVDMGPAFAGMSLRGFYKINSKGKLRVSLYRKKGDFWFNGASLWAKGFTKIPAPGTFALVVLGLLGLAARRKLNA